MRRAKHRRRVDSGRKEGGKGGQMEKREGGADKEMASEERGQEGGGAGERWRRKRVRTSSQLAFPPFYGFIK